MAGLSTLEFAPACRVGTKVHKGPSKSERHFLDLIVDGNSLYARFNKNQMECISPFRIDRENPEVAKTDARHASGRLTLAEPADLPNNRRSLYLCPECADLWCGAVSVVIERNDGTFIWRDFGFENNWEEKLWTEDFVNFGPFVFNASEYVDVFQKMMSFL